jgi:type I restriction enzyme, R subunit
MTNEAFSRVKIDAQLKDQGWAVADGNAVRFEYVLPDKTKADYVLCDRNGRSLAVVEAKKASINPADAAAQAKAYAEQLKVPFIFLANGEEVRFWGWESEAHPRVIKTFFGPEDLERRFATRKVRRDARVVPIDHRIVERDYQTDCIEVLTGEFHRGRRKMLVEMATGTGKTRMAAAFIKRLFEANAVTRVLFLVDRNTLAKQTEDAFAEHLPDYPSYRLQSGRRFQDEKRITITTLQSMINIYRDYSAGYFDLVISDECHRSIYGKWRGVLEHFDGVQVGLTATPCVANVEDGAPDEEDKAFVRDTMRFFEVERPTYSYKMKDAIKDGYLVPYQIYKAQTVKTAAEGGFPVSRAELDWTGMDSETRVEFEKLFAAEGDPISVDPSALERRFTVPERNRAMVREYRDVLTNGYVDGKGMQRKPLLGKTIVFAVTKRHAETLAQLFDAEFAHLKPSPGVRFADYVVSGLGAEDSPDGETIIKRFKKEKYPEILVSVNMLDTGFDCPEVVNLVFARFTKSAILYQQMRGRGTRKATGKSVFTLFDFVGVADYHGDDDAVGEGGVVVVTGPRTPPHTPRKLLVVDVDDHIDPLSRAWITTDDDGRLVFPEASVAKAAEVGVRFEAWLLTQPSLSADQRRWLGLVGSQLRANADGWDEFSAGHFAFEPFSSQGGLGQAMRVFGGKEPLEALLSSLNAAVFPPGSEGSSTRALAHYLGDATLP